MQCTSPKISQVAIASNLTSGKLTSNLASLLSLGWHTLVIRECASKGRNRRPVNALLDQAAHWLASTDRYVELHGLSKGLEQRENPA